MLENLDELYSKIEELEEEIIEVPELQLYLQSLYSLLTEFKDKEASLDTFYEIIQKSFFSHNFHFVQSVYQIKQLIYESPVPDSRLQHCRREYLSSQHSPLLSHNDYQSSHRDR